MATASQTLETNSVDNLHHFTVERFNQAKSAGVFGHSERVSLAHGIVVKEPPQTARCANLTNSLSRHLRSALKRHFLVYGRRPVEVNSQNEPTADVLVVNGLKSDYEHRHPSSENVLLVVEVADVTATYDLGDKANLYAQAGITDYWVVLVKDSAVVRHRMPMAGGYDEVVRLSGQDAISPLAAPDAVWTVDALLGREEQQ